MEILVTYDIQTTSPAGRRRLRHVHLTCKNYGQRVQFSVFECSLDQAGIERLEHELLDIIDPESDSIRLYLMHADRSRAIRAHGVDRYRDFQDTLVL